MHFLYLMKYFAANSNTLIRIEKVTSFLVRLTILLTLTFLLYLIQLISSNTVALAETSNSNTHNESSNQFDQDERQISTHSSQGIRLENTEETDKFAVCFNEVLEDFSADDDHRLNALTALPSGIQMLKSLKTLDAIKKYFHQSCGQFKSEYMTAQIQREAQEILIQPQYSSQLANQEIHYYTEIIQSSLTQVDPKNENSYSKIYIDTQAIRDLAYFISRSDLGLSNIQINTELTEITAKAIRQVEKLPFELQLSYIGALLNSAEDAKHCAGYCQLPEMKDEFLKRLKVGQYSGLYSLKLALMKGRPLTIEELDAYEPKEKICGIKNIWQEVLAKIDPTILYNYISINKDHCGNYIELFLKNQNVKLIVNNEQEKRKIEIQFKVNSAGELFKIITQYANDAE